MHNLIPPNLLTRLLFFDEWEEPFGFRTMPSTKRKLLYEKLREQSTPTPTETNFWIWFGEYRGRNLHPMSTDQYVVRALYNSVTLHDAQPLAKGRRLTNSFARTYSDVNPYKYVPSMMRRGHHIDLRDASSRQLWGNPNEVPTIDRPASAPLPVPEQGEEPPIEDFGSPDDPFSPISRALRAIKEEGWKQLDEYALSSLGDFSTELLTAAFNHLQEKT